MRIVHVEVRIQAGPSCKECPARKTINWNESYCRLYDVKLNSHVRRISGTRDPWGHNKTATVYEKCEQCKKDDEDSKFS